MVDFKAGDRINNRYEIVRRLGAGAMGCVYEALDLVENKIRVALKVLISESLEEQDVWAKGEYEALTRLRHPNLARVFDFGRIQGTPDYYIVTEFIRGTDLYSATEYSSYEEICDLIVQVCRALEYIHSQGYVHFDIKPDNILVTRHRCATMREGSKVLWVPHEHRPESGVYEKLNAKLIDFGLAEKITGSFDFAIKGTLHYLAPEMINGGTPDRRADLYSLGVTFYQVVNRDLPFHHEISESSRTLRRSELFERHMKKLPRYLREVILKLLAERPEERFQSAKEVIEALSEGSGRHYELETRETRHSYLHSPVLIGRQQELSRLKEYGRVVFPQVRTRLGDGPTTTTRPPLVLVSGEIGSGKSRLVEEFRHFLKLNYVQVYFGNCYDGQNRAYQPFVEALRQLAVYLGRDDPVFQRHRDALLRLLPEFKAPEDIERPLGLRPDQEKLYFIDRIVHFLVEAARREPYALVLNNLHWADEMTIELLGYLLQNIVEEDHGEKGLLGILVVGTLRTDERLPSSLRQLLVSLREDGRCDEILLRRFNLQRVRELIRSTLHLTTIPDTFVERIAERTGGNPLFVLETLKSLQEAGIIRPGTSGWEVTIRDIRRIELPKNVELALLGRFKYLDPRDRELVEILAVAKRPVPLSFFDAWPDIEAKAALPRLRFLSEKGFVRADLVDGRELFSLDQPSLGDTIYRNLPEERRKELHRTIASVLREVYADQQDEVLEELAQHYRFSGEEDLALELSLRAGQRLRRIYANQKAFECYAYAAEVLAERGPEEPRWREVHEELGELSIAVGKYDEALRVYDFLIKTEAETLSPVKEALYYRQKGRVFEIQGDYDRALPAYKRVRELLADFEPGTQEAQLEKIRGINALAGLYVRMGKYEKAMQICVEALRTIEGVSETIEHAAVFTTIGMANYFRGNLNQAITFHTRSLEIEEKLGDATEMVLTLNNLGDAYMALGRYQDAKQCFDRAVELSEEVGDPYGRALSLHGLGNFYLAMGVVQKAREAQEASLRLSRTYRMRRLSHRNYALQGLIARQNGELSKAEGSLLRALTAYAKQGSKWELCWLLCRIASVHRLAGNFDQAERVIKDARRLSEDLKIDRLRLETVLEEGKLLEATGRYDEALKVLEDAGGIVESVGSPELTAELLGTLGDVLARLRHVAPAREIYERAAEKAAYALQNVPEEFRESYRCLHAPWFRQIADEEISCEGTGQGAGAEGGGEDREDRLDVVTELSALLVSGGTPEEVLPRALQEVTSDLGAEYGFLLRREGAEDFRVLYSCSKTGKEVEHPSSHIAEEVIAYVLETGKALSCTNTATHPVLQAFDSVVANNVRSVLVVPLRAGRKIVGILYVANPAVTGGAEALRERASPFVPLLTMGLNQVAAVTAGGGKK